MQARFAQRVVLGSICLALTTALPAARQGKGKPTLPEIPGQVALSCAGPAGPATDSVCGDGDAVYVHNALAAGDTGVQVRLREGDHQFGFRFDPLLDPARYLTVYIPTRLPRLSHECNESAGNCFFGSTAVGEIAVVVAARDAADEDARIQTTMRDARGNTISGGPMTLDVLESAPIDVLIGFNDENGYRWALYWSPGVNYPGSTTAQITRTAACEWVIEATEDHVVGLRFFGTGINTGTGKTKGHFEGRYIMPFRLTFTADDASMPGGCS